MDRCNCSQLVFGFQVYCFCFRPTSGFSSEGIMCLKAHLLFLAVVASQVRCYIKPQGLSFLCLPVPVATTVLSLGLISITQRNLKLSVPWKIIKTNLSLPRQAFCPVRLKKVHMLLICIFQDFQAYYHIC